MTKTFTLILVALLGVVGFVVARRLRDAREERELWHEATTAPDLR